MHSPPAESSSQSATSSGRLLSASFLGLLFTQFLTAINDNIFRWLAIGVGKDFVDVSQEGMILMAGTVCFVLPYLVLAAPAGYLADRFSKRSVIITCKFAEVLIMGLGILAIWLGSLQFLFAVVALTGIQSALFSPSKLGAIPEILPAQRISAANGLFGLTTVSATVIGMGIGNLLSETTGEKGQAGLQWSAAVLLGIAVVGLVISFAIRKLPVANPTLAFPWNAANRTLSDLKTLASNQAMLRVALGIVFFWAVGALAQLNVDQLASEGGALTETAKVPLLVALVFGVGIGSVLAGVWSGGKIELGILPLGAFGIALASMLLFTVQGTIIQPTGWTAGFIFAGVLLFVLGISAGLFNVPLESYLQHRSPANSRGSILAASNFLTFTGVTLSSFLYGAMRFPIFEPSWDRVPVAIRGEPSAADAAQVRAIESSFQESLARGDEPRIEESLRDVSEQLRTPVLGRLLWHEFTAMRAHKEFIQLSAYYERFPDHRPLVKAVYDATSKAPLLTARQVFLIAGLFTLPVFVYIVCLIPQASIRFVVWLLSRTVYRVKVVGREWLPEQGGALLVPNHVSLIDGVLLLLASSRPIRMVVSGGDVQGRLLRWLGKLWGVIQIGSNPKVIARALDTARTALKNGELVCIFPEGEVSRSGQLMGFKPGAIKILEGTDVPVVPVYLDGLWGSIFSFDQGRFFWKWPKQWPYPVSIIFGAPITRPDDVNQLRSAVQDLGAQAVQQRSSQSVALIRDFVRRCKKRSRQFKIADSMGQELSGGMLLMKTLILRRLLRRHVLADDEKFVGLLLPPSVGAFVANMALAIDHRVSVNLNYTVSESVMNACIRHADIRHVLTSRRAMEKFNLKLDAEVVYIEEFKDKVTLADKLASGLQAFALPAGVVANSLGADRVKPDDVLTIIFTSGSTGTPKGVMLTQANISHNVDVVNQVVHLNSQDVLIGILPFFHSFGYTVTMWCVATLDVAGAYHFNPLDAQQVGKLCQKYKGTIFLSTPTFLRTYMRRCDKEQLGTLDVVVCGAEKLSKDLSDSFEQKFGVRPVEGYGSTELSPLVSVNIPPTRSSDENRVVLKEGTVGRPLPGVAAKIVDLETGKELGTNQPGMLLIKGPNVMKGYLKRDDLTAEVMRDGWYVTGDVALIDDDGFITITGRESRFSKIGGEMVPHIQIEEVLNRILASDDETLKAAVSAIPDGKKGERLVVLHVKIDKSVEELRKGLADEGLPNLYIPSADSFAEVAELPILGTGKLDLKKIKQTALELFSGY